MGVKCYSLPIIQSLSFPSSIGLFDKFEVSFTMGASYSNPYDPDIISVYAIFTAPGGTETYKVDAFYYEDYSFQKVIVGNDYYEKVSDSLNDVGWRIRFTPTKIGTWRFRIIARDANGNVAQMPMNARNYSFDCTAVENAAGFISKANTRFLKRDVVKDGVRRFHSFFPIGPNVGWYSCRDYGTFEEPRGIYEYERYIDSLCGCANYMRIFLNRYQYISLYGPEYTKRDTYGNPIVYFNNTINQKDSAELDHIITYALQHGVTIMPSIFSFGDFRDVNSQDPGDPSVWRNNPYYTELGLSSPCDFFTDSRAIKITKNLIRYIVSRWGYATNIMGWEFWNEVSNMFYMCDGYKHIDQDVQEWHDEMASYIENIDPFSHCITTSTGGVNDHPYIYSVVFNDLDIVQQHNYQNIQKAKSKEQISNILYKRTNEAHVDYPSLPFFMGEFGFGQGSSSPSYAEKDPFGIDLHNSLWSSLFSTAIGPASFWWWQYLDNCGLFKRFAPLLNFCENLPILSDSFYPNQTGVEIGYRLVFPTNNLETYFMLNDTEDTIYGWCQDTAFAYQSLRWITDSVRLHTDSTGYALHFVDDGVFDPLGYVYTLDSSKRPQPSSSSNVIEIPITNQPIGSSYLVKWFNSETGLVYNTRLISNANVHLNGDGRKVVSFSFPSYIRDIGHQTINNTFGDAVFSLILSNNQPNQKFDD